MLIKLLGITHFEYEKCIPTVRTVEVKFLYITRNNAIIYDFMKNCVMADIRSSVQSVIIL